MVGHVLVMVMGNSRAWEGSHTNTCYYKLFDKTSEKEGAWVTVKSLITK